MNCNPKGTDEINSNLGSIDIFFAKYDKNGNFLWAKSLGTSGADIPTAVKVDFYGNVFVTGYFGSENLPGRFIDLDPGPDEDRHYGEGGIDCFLIKLNPFGDYQWGFVLGNLDDNSTEIIWDMDINKAGELYLAGVFSGTVDFNPMDSRKRISCPATGHGYFTAKYDRKGENVWVTKVGANIIEPLKEGFISIDIDGSDGCIIGGNFRNTAKFEPDIDTDFPMVSAGGSDMFLARYSSMGKIIMRGGFGGEESDRIFPNCAKIGNDGNIYITGNFLGKSDFYPSFGTYEIENSGTDPEIFLASYSLSGAMRWAFNVPSGYGEDAGCGLDFDIDGNICLAGYFRGVSNFDPDGTKELASNGSDGAGDAFLAKYDNGGHLIWINNYGDALSGNDKYGRPQLSIAQAVVVDENDNAILTGRFYGDIDFDPSDEDGVLSSERLYDLFIAKYDYDGYLWFEGGVRPSMRVVSPNGGEIWNVDSLRIITWYSKNVEEVRIEYTLDNGTNWLLLADSVSAPSSSYTWVVENNPSEECKVKITNIADEKIYDASNGKFTITNEIKPSRVIFSWGNPGAVSGKAVATDSRNSFIVAGSFQGTINCDQGKGVTNLSPVGNNDMAIVKYNEFGDLIWAFNIGSTGMNCGPNCLSVDGADNIYVSGYFGRAGAVGATLDFNPSSEVDTLATTGGFDAFIAKYSSEGKFLWAISFGNNEGTSKEVINDMSVERNGTIYVTGVYSGQVDFDPSKSENILESTDGNTELFAAKYSNDGNYRWAIGIGTNMKDADTEGLASIQSDGSGGCFLSGNFRDSVNFDPSGYLGQELESKAQSDIFIAHYKINSYLDWAVQIEGNGEDYIGKGCLKKSSDGSLFLSGVFEGKADFSPGLINRELTSTANNRDIFIASYRTNGDLRWVKNLPSIQGDDLTKAMAFDTAGNIVLTGFFKEDIDFGESESSFTFSSNGTQGAADIFLAKFNVEGDILWADQFGTDTTGSDNISEPFDISIDSQNNSIITGNFFGEEVDFDPSDNIYYLSSQGRNDAFIAKYFEDGGLWIQAVDSSQLYLITPNGGEKWQIGARQHIIWHSLFIDSLSIKYSIDSGADWITIEEAVTAESGSYTWTVPNTASENCKVLIYDPGNLRRMDYSAGEFTITDQTISIQSPNGGEVWKSDSTEIIKWNSNKVKYIDIYYSTNGGDDWNPILISFSAASGSFSWKVRKTSSVNCLMKIMDNDNPEIYDISDSFFTIKKSQEAELNLISPNGGELWLINNSYNIMWLSKEIENVRIELSTDGGSQWEIIESVIPADNYFVEWMIDEEISRSDSCLIRITFVDDDSISDISDSLFSIDIDDLVFELQDNLLEMFTIYPQPATDYLKIRYHLTINCPIKISIINNLGLTTEVIENKYQDAGTQEILVNTKDIPTGMYF
ncbi:hypothetical protein ACFLSQ_10670, partial [Bacteroidota bacterium]